MNNKLYIAISFFSIERKGEKRSSFTENLLPEMMNKICSIKEIQIEKSPMGKPGFIKPEGWFYNISHSRDVGVCAIGKRELGIDIEFIKTNRDFPAIAETWFTKKEYDYLSLLSVNAEELFYHLWTRKESLIKQHGKSVWNMKEMPHMLNKKNNVKTWLIKKGSDSLSLSLSVDSIKDHEIEVEIYQDYFNQPLIIDLISFPEVDSETQN